MNVVALMLAASMASSPIQVEECEGFPSERSVHFTLRDIDYGFRRGDSTCDNWAGFVPLLSNVVESQSSALTQEVAKIESKIVTRFAIYSFACEYDHLLVKANFDGRRDSAWLLSQFSLVRSDTNALFKLADWLSGAVPLAADKETRGNELGEAMRIDALMIYGGKRPPIYPGSVGNYSHCGPMWRECRDKFHFRRTYNERLPKFREEALGCFHVAIVNGYADRTEAERETIWDEFCRRAKASDSEKEAASRIRELPRQCAKPRSANNEGARGGEGPTDTVDVIRSVR